MLKMSLKILSLPTILYFPIIPTIFYLFFEISLLGSGLCVDLTVRNSMTGSKKANKTSMKIDTFFRIREELLYFTSPPPEILCIVVFHTCHIVWEGNVCSYTFPFYTRKENWRLAVGRGLLYTVSWLWLHKGLL